MKTQSTILAVLLALLVCAAVGFPQQWTYQFPRPSGDDLTCIEFVDLNTGWAAGEHGTILHTVDGGATWTQQFNAPNLGGTMTIRDIEFVDQSNGWALGFALGNYLGTSSLLHTSNGGQSWDIQREADSTEWRSLFFLDAQQGWIVGWDARMQSPSHVLRTTDGGQTWEPQRNGIGPELLLGLQDIFFVTDQQGFAVGYGVGGGHTLHTGDGGSHWAGVVQDNHSYDHVIFSSASEGWRIGSTTGANGRSTVWRTTNAGASWDTVRTSVWGPYFDAVSTGQGRLHVVSSGNVTSTTNGGATWVSRHTSNGGSAHSGVTAIGSDRIWLCGERGSVFNSMNAGDAWQLQSGAMADSLPTLLSIAFLSSQTGVAVGNAGGFRTTDGGASWTPVHDLTGVISFSMAIADPIVAVTAGSPYSMRTTDAGLSWQPLPVRGTYDVAFASSISGCRVGHTGYVDRTTDAGMTWLPVASATNEPLRAIAFANANQGWAVGDNGAIIQTQNGGSFWFADTSHSQAGLRDIAALGSTVCAVGDSGLVLYRDGGRWHRTITPTGHGLTSVVLSSAFNGIASSGNYDESFITSDGGRTWTMDAEGAYAFRGMGALIQGATTHYWGVHDGGVMHSAQVYASADDRRNHGQDMSFVLSSFPNPFNSSTSIVLNIPRTGRVDLAVFDLLGQRVATIESGVLSAGTHTYTYSPESLSSGIYFVRSQTPSSVATNKIVYLK